MKLFETLLVLTTAIDNSISHRDIESGIKKQAPPCFL